MSQIHVFDNIFDKVELLNCLEWAERVIGLAAITDSLQGDRKATTYHLCLAGSADCDRHGFRQDAAKAIARYAKAGKRA